MACSFVPYAGIQHDEALFAAPLYHDHPREYCLRAFGHNVPLMLLTYLGAAKSWLFALLFAFWPPSIWSVRLPAILIGAGAIGATFLLVRRMAGAVAALVCASLLATDPMYLLTTTFDWGPVAIQHLCWAAGVYLVLTGHDRNSAARFACGFGFLGLGMWDKALFAWILSGTALATLILFPRQVRQSLTTRNTAAAVIGFLIGGLPLVLYNVRQPLKTFQGNTSFSVDGVGQKAELAKWTLSGSGLFGYLVNDEWVTPRREPRNTIERFSVSVREAAGERRSNLMFHASIAALLLAPLWWRRGRRAALFVLIAIAIAWPQMALNRDTGGAVHHAVLLWPLPHILVAVAIAAAADRIRHFPRLTAGVVTGVLVAANLLVLNQYFSQFVRGGAAGVWTDAVVTLSEYFRRNPDGVVVTTDWGVFETVHMLNQGRLHLIVGDDHVNREPDQQSRDAIAWILSQDRPRFVVYERGFEVNPGAAKRLIANTEALGYRSEVDAEIRDSNGRPVFRVLRFAARAGAGK